MNEIRVLEEDEFLCDYDAEEEKEIYEDNEMLDAFIKLQKHYGSKENGIILPKGTKLRLVEKATKQNFPSLWEICNSKIQIILYE